MKWKYIVNREQDTIYPQNSNLVLSSKSSSGKSAIALVLLALQQRCIAPDVTSISHQQHICHSTYSHTSLYQF